MLRLGAFREQWMALALVLSALIGVVLGALQVSGTGDVGSHWYFYAVTNSGAAVGFFANANHMAILLVTTLPFLVAMYEVEGSRSSSLRAQASAGKVAILGGTLVVILVGIALNGSLAGFALGAIVVAASLFVRARLDRPVARWVIAAVGLGGLVAIATLVVSPMQNNLTGTGVEKDYGSRYTSFTNSLHATVDHFPVGSGIGSFANVYPAYENPAWVDRWYVNHVHNDYIEIALEAGLPGILLMAAFLLWWMQRVVAIWRAPTIDHFARAATIASGAILLHSLVDFPLRTTAISAVFAFCIALMVGVRRRSAVEAPVEEHDQGARHLSIG
jgi:O-antigen ligase